MRRLAWFLPTPIECLSEVRGTAQHGGTKQEVRRKGSAASHSVHLSLGAEGQACDVVKGSWSFPLSLLHTRAHTHTRTHTATHGKAYGGST